jgi:hypothetical protein
MLAFAFTLALLFLLVTSGNLIVPVALALVPGVIPAPTGRIGIERIPSGDSGESGSPQAS